MTLMSLYMLCVVAGGVLMGTSIFLGGDHDHDADFDADFDADLDADFDADIDADADLDVDAHADLDHGGADVAHSGGGLEWSVLPFGSLRFWTFLVETFGLTGALLSCAGIPSAATLGIAISVGTLMGWSAFVFFRWLAKEEVSGQTALSGFKESEGRVLVRIPVGGKGKILLKKSGGRVEMLATSMDGEEIPKDAQVLVVGVADGVAQVTALTARPKEASEAAREAVAAAARRQSEKNL